MATIKLIILVLFAAALLAGSAAVILATYAMQDEKHREKHKIGSWQRRFRGEGYDFFDA